MDKKICAVCLSVGRPAILTAAWIKNELIMGERKYFPERRRLMELELLRDLREKEEKGFTVLVEEDSGFITSRVGQRIRLRDEHVTGRPVLIEAMQIYQELDRQQAIKRPRQESGKYILHRSIFDEERDKKGQEFYNINWDDLTTEHVLTLLCCYATEYNNAASASFIKSMAGEMRSHDEQGLMSPMLNMLRGLQQIDEQRVPQGVLTGKGNIL